MKYRPFDAGSNALLLGEAEELVYVDRKMLTACGVRRSVFISDGVKAARFLAELSPDQYPGFIFCTGLADMSSLDFLELIRLHPDLYNLPLVLVVNQLNQQHLAVASKLGRCSFLVRPYTQLEMENAIISAGRVRSRLAPCENSLLFEQALESREAERQAERQAAQSPSLLLGRSLLRQGRHREACVAFARHLEENTGKRGNALYGLAEAFAGLGLEDRSVQYLHQSATAYIEEKDFMAARAVFARLQGQGRQGTHVNPLYEAGVRLTSEGSYHSAVQAFMQGQMLTPELSFHSYAAEACQAAPNPGHCAERICWHLERRIPSMGQRLRDYLLISEDDEPEFESRTGLFGILREVVEVACYTAKVHVAG